MKIIMTERCLELAVEFIICSRNFSLPLSLSLFSPPAAAGSLRGVQLAEYE